MHEMIRVAAGVVEKLSTSGGRKTWFSRALNYDPQQVYTPLSRCARWQAICVDPCFGRGLALGKAAGFPGQGIKFNQTTIYSVRIFRPETKAFPARV